MTESIGQLIKEAREKQGYSQLQLSLRTGISQALISKWERSKTIPTILSLVSVADALNVTLDSLVGRSTK